MKQRLILLINLLIFLLGCNSKEVKTLTAQKELAIIEADDHSQNWIESFNKFRNALYQNNKIKLKSFFKFPVLNEGNEIWYLIEDEHQLSFAKGEIKPFTESDLNNYYFKLFDQYFVKSILKIKTKELFQKGSYETIMLSDGAISYKTFATYNKEAKQIVLNFYTEEKVESDKNGEYEKAEFSKVYYFDIISNNKLQFNKVRLAG